MQKKLTITIDEELYSELHKRVGRGKISKFIENLVRPQLTIAALEEEYRAMSEDRARETEALKWAESASGDFTDETW